MKRDTTEKAARDRTRPKAPWPVHALKVFLVAFFVNGLLALEFPAEAPAWDSVFRLSPEAFLLLGGMAFWVRAGGPFRGRVYLPAVALILALRVFQSADALVPMIFNRAFNLYMDAQRLPDFLSLFGQNSPPAALAGAAAAGLVAAAAMARAVWGALSVWHRALSGGGASRGSARLLAAAAAVGVLSAGLAGGAPGLVAPPVLPRVAEEIGFILDLENLRGRHRSEIAAAAERIRQAPADLARLAGASVFIFVVESYGHSAFSDPRLAPRVLPAVQAAEAELQAGGFTLAAAFLDSPTFGGRSWLAHGTLESGLPLTDQIRHDLLLESELTPLAGIYRRAGYRTVRAMPGTQWLGPEGIFFQYDQTYIAPDFGYRGPPFSWASMPDQFVLDWVHRREVRGAPRPLLAEFILSCSHAPWDVQPPLVEDWRRIGDGTLFHELAPAVYPTSWTELAQASEAYSAAIVHQIRLLTAFIRGFLPEGALAVILGDHQPCRELIGPDASWAVPVHVASRRRDLVERFGSAGFQAGMVPAAPAGAPAGLEVLFRVLTAGLSVKESAPE
jgi:hypothetical protein